MSLALVSRRLALALFLCFGLGLGLLMLVRHNYAEKLINQSRQNGEPQPETAIESTA